jgi:hypothetical protein
MRQNNEQRTTRFLDYTGASQHDITTYVVQQHLPPLNNISHMYSNGLPCYQTTASANANTTMTGEYQRNMKTN